MRLSPALALSALALVTSTQRAAADLPAGRCGELIADADRLWAARSAGSTGGHASASAVEPLLKATRDAAREDGCALEGRWRLMRALYFAGEHLATDRDAKRRLFDEGRKVGEEALAAVRRLAAEAGDKRASRDSPRELAERLRATPGVTACFLWSAVDWGKWALVFGKLAAVREGAASKIRDLSQAVVAVDPTFEEAGGLRVLGRLHHQSPKVPLLTGWVSREEAVKDLDEAVRLAPRNFVNRLYLADALHDLVPARRAEARAMLEKLVADTPSPEYLVEDRATQEEAAALLKSWEAGH